MSCRTDMSPAAIPIEAAMSAHMVGAGLGDALVSIRQVQWAAVCRCYSRLDAGAHLAALILMLLASDMGHGRSGPFFRSWPARSMAAGCAGLAELSSIHLSLESL